MYNLSVIIPVLNEEKYLPSLIESIDNQTVNKAQVQIIFIDGGSNDHSVEMLKTYSSNSDYGSVSIMCNPQKIVPISLNIGIQAALGDIIARLDAHSSYPKDYFSAILFYHSVYPNAMNIGFQCETKAYTENSKSKAIAYSLSTLIGVGNSEFRVGINEIKKVDTVPFGSFKRIVFKRVGNFNEKLERNQDIELNKRIRKAQMTILLIPNPILTYYSRETFLELSLSNYKNGLWNIYTAGITKGLTSLSIRHYVPLVFVATNIFLIFLSIYYSHIVFLSPLILYFFILIIFCSRSKIKHNIHPLYLFISYIVLHFSYGLGSIGAILKNLFNSINFNNG